MDLVKLTEYLVSSLVRKADSVEVTEEKTEEGIQISVLVDESDIGTVIGKAGSNANAIRTIVQAAAYTNHMPRVKINIDSKKED